MKAAAANDVQVLSTVTESRLLEHTLKALKEHSVETNTPRVVTCQVKELLKVENFTVPKSLQIRSQSTRIHRLPMSTQLIHRNLVTEKGSIFGGYLNGYSKFARLHLVLMTNLKLKGVASSEIVYGDYVKDGQFQEIAVVFECDFKERIDNGTKQLENEPIVAQGQYKKQMDRKIRALKSEQQRASSM